MSFDGFPEAALDFYDGLTADNSKAYWTDHKATYDGAVKAPMLALLEELEPEFGSAKLFRPYRDVRFSKDKTPYKLAAAAAIGDDVQGGLYLQLSADGLLIAGGAHGLTTDQARRLRAAIADDRPGTALVTVIGQLRTAGFRVEGDRLKRLPKEFEPDHPRADLLTLKTLFAVQQHPPAEWLHTPEALARVRAAWHQVHPLNEWLRRHVGPARAYRRTPTPSAFCTSIQSRRKASATLLRGSDSTTGSCSSPIRSTAVAEGMGVGSIRGSSDSSAMTSLWSALRLSTIEKKARSGGACGVPLSRKSASWSRVRSDSVVGMSGTSSSSAASNTFSDSRLMLGGQSSSSRS
jgi:uncharacterized protein (TIGR02453 family)